MIIIKRLFCFTFAVAILAVIVSPAFAHSGKTDGNGGHRDHSTGEYHYHHGYSAHQHYDMDGDGDLDCPYDFDDKTNKSYGASETYRSIATPEPTPKQTPVPTQKPTPKQETISNNREFIFVILSIAIFSCISTAVKKTEERKKQQEKFIAEKKEYEKLYGDISTLEASGAPPFCFVGEDGLPAIKDNSREKWGENYTFYITASGKSYHTGKCRYAVDKRRVKAINAYLVYHYSPCSICRPNLPIMEWYKEYNVIKGIRSKYDIPEPRN